MTDTFVQDLLAHPAVTGHGIGVSSADLASLHDVLMDEGHRRFRGAGKDQYESVITGNRASQKFEDMSMDELVQALIEEIVDVQNYMTMITVKALAALRLVAKAQ